MQNEVDKVLCFLCGRDMSGCPVSGLAISTSLEPNSLEERPRLFDGNFGAQ